MKKGRGPAKGAEYERQVCVQLSLWVSDMRKKDLYWRSAMSGGRSTLFSRKSLDERPSSSGDVTSVDPEGSLLTNLFTVECKFWAKWDTDPLIYDMKGPIGIFWEQVCEDAKRVQNAPMLIAKRNRKPQVVCTNVRGFQIFRELKPCFTPRLIAPRLDMYIWLLQDILVLPFSNIRSKYERFYP